MGVEPVPEGDFSVVDDLPEGDFSGEEEVDEGVVDVLEGVSAGEVVPAGESEGEAPPAGVSVLGWQAESAVIKPSINVTIIFDLTVINPHNLSLFGFYLILKSVGEFQITFS